MNPDTHEVNIETLKQLMSDANQVHALELAECRAALEIASSLLQSKDEENSRLTGHVIELINLVNKTKEEAHP